MKCPGPPGGPACGHDMRIKHTYSAGDAGETRRAQCPKCLTTVALLQVIVSVEPERGHGAGCLAKRLKEGRCQPLDLL